jgi:hypothetical protein
MLTLTVNVSASSSKYTVGLELSQISPNSLAVVFNYFSEATWELPTGFLKRHVSYRRLF